MVRHRKPGKADTGRGANASKFKKPKAAPRVPDRKDSKIKAWNRPEDIPQDEQDLFFAGRDKILLDGSDAVARNQELEEYDNEEEVFALKGLDGDDDDDEGFDDDDPDDEDEDEEGEDEDDVEESASSIQKPKKTKATPSKLDARSKSAEEEAESEDEERWGKTKSAYYSSAANEADPDDEETRAMEEAEARRLQGKARELMNDDDFGLEDVASDAEASSNAEAMSQVEAPPSGPVARDKKSLLRHLEITSPETLALAREWVDVASDLYEIQAAIEQISKDDPNSPSLGMIHLHHQTLLAYATTLAYYLYVRATPVPGPTPRSQTTARVVPQKVTERLFQLKQSLSILESLGFSALDDDGSDDSDSDSDEDTSSSTASRHALSDAEIKTMLAELDHGRRTDETLKAKRAERMKRAKEKVQATSKPKSKPSPSPKANGAPKVVAASPIFDLEEPEFVPSKPSSSTRPLLVAPSSSYGEPTALDYADTEDKSARRKSLRFHTSRIESASRRRESARSGALGGDDDLPWRDVRREKQQAKDDLAAKQNRGQGGDDLVDPNGPGSEQDNATPATGKGKKRPRQDDDGKENGEAEEGPDGYYELVKKQKREAKQEKKAAYEAQLASSKPDFTETGVDGPRSLTRAILKNRGMTPRRPKAVRNPRVKKRERFEKAKKQMGSKKAIFKGGLASLPGGRYEGEKTGISNVVKSVKL